MTWFKRLTGFAERSSNQVRENITVEGETMTSIINGRSFACGRLETPSLGEFRKRIRRTDKRGGRISVKEVVADVQALHADVTHAGSLFQVASQFNLLEMVHHSVTPEHGVGIYENDPTQGPACAIAAGAGTIYRNYFAPVNGKVGQSRNDQIDCLADLGVKLGNIDNELWQMRNGYALASSSGLTQISNYLRSLNEDERDELRQALRIGLHWNTQVTIGESAHTVSQAYCSALPVAYSNHSADQWEEFARVVLEASYEATVCAAILNARTTGNKKLFLTLLGGGAFGNVADWISDAIKRALMMYKDSNLEVRIVSYGTSKAQVRDLVKEFSC